MPEYQRRMQREKQTKPIDYFMRDEKQNSGKSAIQFWVHMNDLLFLGQHLTVKRCEMQIKQRGRMTVEQMASGKRSCSLLKRAKQLKLRNPTIIGR